MLSNIIFLILKKKKISSQLVDVAFKVFNSREQWQNKEDEKWNAPFLEASQDSWKLNNTQRGKWPWGREQGAYCKEEGQCIKRLL